MSNPYWEKICGIAEAQRAKGIATYGHGIEENPADMPARITHLQEELVDALMYCEWIKDMELLVCDVINAAQDNLSELVRLSAEYANATCRGHSCMECRYHKFGDKCYDAARDEFLMQNGVVIAVRCKDCVHYNQDENVCLKIYSDGAVSPYAWQHRNPDDFCSYGERGHG